MAEPGTGFLEQLKSCIVWSWTYLWTVWFFIMLFLVYILRVPLKINDNLTTGTAPARRQAAPAPDADPAGSPGSDSAPTATPAPRGRPAVRAPGPGGERRRARTAGSRHRRRPERSPGRPGRAGPRAAATRGSGPAGVRPFSSESPPLSRGKRERSAASGRGGGTALPRPGPWPGPARRSVPRGRVDGGSRGCWAGSGGGAARGERAANAPRARAWFVAVCATGVN